MIFNNINAKNPSPPLFTNKQLKLLINGLLSKDPATRMKWSHVQSHPWLTDVKWDDFINLRIIPPWKPLNNKAANTDCFLSWNDLKLPTDTVSHEVAAYCNSISIPKAKAEPPKVKSTDLVNPCCCSVDHNNRDEKDCFDKSSKSKPSPLVREMSRRKSTSSGGAGSPLQVVPDNTPTKTDRRASMSKQVSMKGNM